MEKQYLLPTIKCVSRCILRSKAPKADTLKVGPGGQGIIDDPCGPIMYYAYGKYTLITFVLQVIVQYLQRGSPLLITAPILSKPQSKCGQYQL